MTRTSFGKRCPAWMVCVAMALLVAGGGDAGSVRAQRTTPRVVAIGDVHGDLDAFMTILGEPVSSTKHGVGLAAVRSS